MFRLPVRANLLPCGSLLTFLFGDPDAITKDTATVQRADTSAGKTETGLDRLKRMFTLDEFDHASVEIIMISQVACMSTFVGAVYGGFMSSRTAYMNFMKNNQASVFKSHWEAKKKLQDSVTVNFGKGAFKWSWRLALFSTSYMGISTCISTYRGKYGIMEHVIAGGVSGAMYKFTMGPRGWIVGGCLGGVLGVIAGTASYGILKISGMSMQDVQYWQYRWKESREEKFKETIDRLRKEEIMIRHELKHGEAAKSLDNLPVDKV